MGGLVWFIGGHEQDLSEMMVALLLYAYTQDVYASRRIAHDVTRLLAARAAPTA